MVVVVIVVLVLLLLVVVGGVLSTRRVFSPQGRVDSKAANLPGLLLSCCVMFSSFPSKDGVKSSTQDLHAAADCKSNFLSLFGLFVAIILSTIKYNQSQCHSCFRG